MPVLARGAFAATMLALVAVVPGAAGAQEARSIHCKVGDHNVALELLLPLAQDGSGAATRAGMQGSLDIQHQKVARDRRRWNLDGRQPAQLWHDGRELKIKLQLAPGDALVELVIETLKRPGTDAHAGHYRVRTGEGARVEGRIECRTD